MVVGICSSIGILEPHAKFQQNRMGGFRDRCFEGVFYEVSFLSWGAGSGSLPTRPEEVGRCPDHLALQACVKIGPLKEIELIN